MNLQNQNWIAQSTETSGTIAPTRSLLSAGSPGLRPSAEQDAFVRQAYQQFCTQVRLSTFPTGYHTATRTGADGTVVRMESNAGVHRVFVSIPGAPGGEKEIQLPSGIGICFTDLSGAAVEGWRREVSAGVFEPQPLILTPVPKPGKPPTSSGRWRFKKVPKLLGGNILWVSADRKKWASSFAGRSLQVPFGMLHNPLSGKANEPSWSPDGIKLEWTPATYSRFTPESDLFDGGSRSKYVFRLNEVVKLFFGAGGTPPAIYAAEQGQWLWTLDKPLNDLATTATIYFSTTLSAKSGLDGPSAPSYNNATSFPDSRPIAAGNGRRFGRMFDVSPFGDRVMVQVIPTSGSTSTRYLKTYRLAAPDFPGAPPTVEDSERSIPPPDAVTTPVGGNGVTDFVWTVSLEPVMTPTLFSPGFGGDFSGEVNSGWRENRGFSYSIPQKTATTETRQWNRSYYLQDGSVHDEFVVTRNTATAHQTHSMTLLKEGPNLATYGGSTEFEYQAVADVGSTYLVGSTASTDARTVQTQQVALSLPEFELITKMRAVEFSHQTALNIPAGTSGAADPAALASVNYTCKSTMLDAWVMYLDHISGFSITLELQGEAVVTGTKTFYDPFAQLVQTAGASSAKVVVRKKSVVLFEEVVGTPLMSNLGVSYPVQNPVSPYPTDKYSLTSVGAPLSTIRTNQSYSYTTGVQSVQNGMYYPTTDSRTWYNSALPSASTAIIPYFGIDGGTVPCNPAITLGTASTSAVAADHFSVFHAKDPTTGAAVVNIHVNGVAMGLAADRSWVFLLDETGVKQLQDIIDAPSDVRVWAAKSLNSLVSI